MPTRYAHAPAHPPQHRQYRNNIRRKGALEVEMIWESEAVPMYEKRPSSTVDSPVSVQDVYLPEIKPLVLPESWTVVGKNGKPLKGKMYDEPRKPKKKKSRKSKAKVEIEPLADLEEAACSSKCLHMSDLCNAKHFKEATRGREAKYWRGYRDSKAVEKEANHTLKAMFAVAELARAGVGSDEGRLARRLEKMHEQMVTSARETMASQDKERRKSDKGDRHKQKMRRAARSYAAAERCFALDEDNEYDDVLLSPRPQKKEKAADVNVGLRSLAMHSQKHGPQKRGPNAKNASQAKSQDKRKYVPEAGSAKAGKKDDCFTQVKKKKSCSLM